jgi:hypothetical protein
MKAATIERALQRAWAKAAEAGDSETIELLREVFEGQGLGLMVWAKLTPRTVERVEDLDYGGRYFLLNQTTVVWPDMESAEDSASWLESEVEAEQERAISGVFFDMSMAQEDLLNRQVERSMRKGRDAIRAAIRRCVHPDWLKRGA